MKGLMFPGSAPASGAPVGALADCLWLEVRCSMETASCFAQETTETTEDEEDPFLTANPNDLPSR